MTGFLLAGVGNLDLRKKSNFLVVNESTFSQQSRAPSALQKLPDLGELGKVEYIGVLTSKFPMHKMRSCFES